MWENYQLVITQWPTGVTPFAPKGPGVVYPAGSASPFPVNNAVNTAMERAKTITDPARRAQAWGDVDRAITALAPAVPLVWDKTPMAHSADVNGVANEGLGVWDFAFTSIRG